MDIEDSITQLEEVFEGHPWYGSPILKSLEEIPFIFWDQKLENASHTITELVYHIIDWRVFVIEKLKENELFSVEMNSESDWRKNISVATTHEKKNTIEELKKTQYSMIQLLTTKQDTWMCHFVDGKDYKNEYMVIGVIQHDIYHLGQINFLYNQLKNKV